MPIERTFPPKTEEIAQEWHSTVLSEHPWTPEDQPGTAGGIGQGYYVTAAGLRAFAKPTVLPQKAWGDAHKHNVGACHEKIASDLAFLLGMPVPPALLWHCPQEGRKGVAFRSVSLVPFTPFYTWKQVLRISGVLGKIVPAITQQASAMAVFDTWVDNHDRVNDGNIILGMTPGSQNVRCAYIDFAQSMSFGWKEGPPPAIGVGRPKFPGAVRLDSSVVRETVTAIEQLDDSAIAKIVERVPSEFVSDGRRRCILQGLLARRDGLRYAMVKENE